MYVLDGNFKTQDEALDYVLKKYMSSVEILDYSFVGKVAYVLCSVKTSWSDPFNYIAVLHFSCTKQVWTCNEYDESMNKTEYLDCPIRFLDASSLITPQAKEWKENCLNKQREKLDKKKLLLTKISILEEKLRSNSSCVIHSTKHGQLEVMGFHSNSKSQIIARNEDGAVFRFKLLDLTLDEIKK